MRYHCLSSSLLAPSSLLLVLSHLATTSLAGFSAGSGFGPYGYEDIFEQANKNPDVTLNATFPGIDFSAQPSSHPSYLLASPDGNKDRRFRDNITKVPVNDPTGYLNGTVVNTVFDLSWPEEEQLPSEKSDGSVPVL
jgi:hypothetical protein